MDKIKRIQTLVQQLNTYRNEYYNQNNPEVNDKQYDDLFDELNNLESETGYVPSNSPTQNVGYAVVDKLPKFKHTYPLLSLAKTTDINDFADFTKGKDGDLMLKMDGLTGELIYENGMLISGSTRGDGEEGSLITENIKTFMNVPMRIPYYNHLKITGEMYIHKNDFDEINSKLSKDEKYKTPRNLASGSVQLLDSKECSKRNIYFCAFNVIEGMDEENSLNQRLNNLKDLGFETVKRYTYVQVDKPNITEMVESLREYAIKNYLPVDGMVMMHDDIEYGHSLGRVGHHYKNGYAYKWEQESEETTLKDVEWSMGRTGILTPVAIFDTVNLDNTDVSRASLHNISIIKGLKLGIGDILSIIKANQIIPQVTENQTQSNNLVIPDVCPYCGAKTVIQKDNDSEVLVCTNSDCSGKKLGRFVNFVGKNGMNIDGLSEATLDKLIRKGWLNTFSDIYHLNEHKNEIVHMDGFGLKSYNNLIESIEKSKNVKLEKFLVALGIPNVGKTASKTISKYFNGDDEKFINALYDNFDFTRLDDIGEIINKSIYNWFDNDLEHILWTELIGILIFIKPEQKVNQNMNGIFTGNKLYCTGSFACGKKDELKQMVENAGGEFAAGYAKSLDYLVVGSLKSSSKEDKARKDKVPILTEDKFLEMLK